MIYLGKGKKYHLKHQKKLQCCIKDADMIRKQDSGSINWGFRSILGFPPPETTGV